MIVSELQIYLQEMFSMPFSVRKEMENGFECFISYPDNDEQQYFEVKTYIQNSVRIVVEVLPQKYAVPMLMTMGSASQDKKNIFLRYLACLKKRNVRIALKVNGLDFRDDSFFDDAGPWRNLYCRMTKVPIVDTNESYNERDVICEWTKQVFCLFFSLLSFSEREKEDDLSEGKEEGNSFQVVCNRYERNPINRELCLAKKGYKCHICNFDFEEIYGDIGRKFIHVHHIVPVSQLGPNYLINPEVDLIPVCPNCHAMLHRKNPPYSPEELGSIIGENKK